MPTTRMLGFFFGFSVNIVNSRDCMLKGLTDCKILKFTAKEFFLRKTSSYQTVLTYAKDQTACVVQSALHYAIFGDYIGMFERLFAAMSIINLHK